MGIKFKNRKMIFWFRLFAVFDVLFSNKFELNTYKRNWEQKSKTKFDNDGILNTKL